MGEKDVRIRADPIRRAGQAALNSRQRALEQTDQMRDLANRLSTVLPDDRKRSLAIAAADAANILYFELEADERAAWESEEALGR